MTKYTLIASSAFGARSPIDLHWDGLSISEAPYCARVSISARNGQTSRLADCLREHYSIELPAPCTHHQGSSLALAWTAPDQWFAESAEHDGSELCAQLTTLLPDLASVTDQSDAWVELRVSGNHSRAVLTKLCTLDLHPSVFPPGSAARTVIDHIGTFISLHHDHRQFSLSSARSSAHSFLHALELAANSTCEEKTIRNNTTG